MIKNHYDYIDARYYAIKQGKELKDLTPEEMEMFRVQAESIPVSDIQKWKEEYTMNTTERLADIEKLKKEPNYALLWCRHGNWLIEQVIRLDEITNSYLPINVKVSVDYLINKIGWKATTDLEYLATYETQTVQTKTEEMQFHINNILEFTKSPEDRNKYHEYLNII